MNINSQTIGDIMTNSLNSLLYKTLVFISCEDKTCNQDSNESSQLPREEDKILAIDDVSVIYDCIKNHFDFSRMYAFRLTRPKLDSSESSRNDWRCMKLLGGGFLLKGFDPIFNTTDDDRSKQEGSSLCNFNYTEGKV